MFTGTPALVLAGLPAIAVVEWRAVSVAAWSATAYAALLSLTAAYFLWSRSIQQLGAARTAIYSCGVPLVAAAIAVVLLGERPTPTHVVGALLIVAGVLLSQREGRLTSLER
jgi:drug/metabolite transporter (DMT)-like permease